MKWALLFAGWVLAVAGAYLGPERHGGWAGLAALGCLGVAVALDRRGT